MYELYRAAPVHKSSEDVAPAAETDDSNTWAVLTLLGSSASSVSTGKSQTPPEATTPPNHLHTATPKSHANLMRPGAAGYHLRQSSDHFCLHSSQNIAFRLGTTQSIIVPVVDFEPNCTDRPILSVIMVEILPDMPDCSDSSGEPSEAQESLLQQLNTLRQTYLPWQPRRNSAKKK